MGGIFFQLVVMQSRPHQEGRQGLKAHTQKRLVIITFWGSLWWPLHDDEKQHTHVIELVCNNPYLLISWKNNMRIFEHVCTMDNIHESICMHIIHDVQCCARCFVHVRHSSFQLCVWRCKYSPLYDQHPAGARRDGSVPPNSSSTFSLWAWEPFNPKKVQLPWLLVECAFIRKGLQSGITWGQLNFFIFTTCSNHDQLTNAFETFKYTYIFNNMEVRNLCKTAAKWLATPASDLLVYTLITYHQQ